MCALEFNQPPEAAVGNASLNGTADVLNSTLGTCLVQKGIDAAATAEVHFRVSRSFTDYFLSQLDVVV